MSSENATWCRFRAPDGTVLEIIGPADPSLWVCTPRNYQPLSIHFRSVDARTLPERQQTAKEGHFVGR
jgi:hypothetical protein